MKSPSTRNRTVAAEGMPSSRDAEMAILSALMSNPRASADVFASLRDEHFYFEDLRTAFLIMKNLSAQQQLNVIAFSVAWKKIKGKTSFDSAIFNAPALNHKANIRILIDLAARRRILSAIRIAEDALLGAAKTEDVTPDLLAAVLQQDGAAKQPQSMASIVTMSMKRIEEAASRVGAVGVPSGFASFDARMGGFFPGDLIIVGARPAEGKSALLASVCMNASQRGLPTMIASAEMELVDIGTRFIAREADVANFALRRGQVEGAEIGSVIKAGATLSELPIWIYDDHRWDVIQAQIRSMHALHGIKMAAIDYITRLEIGRENDEEQRWQRIGRIAKEAKSLAGELQIPIIIAAQISREVTKGSREPELSDLRESGDIEQDADVVMFLHRYRPIERYHAYLLVKKNRNGPTSNFHLRYVEHRVAYYDWEDD